MIKLYEKNGILFFTEKEIEFREFCEKQIRTTLFENLKSQNWSFNIVKIEAPQFIPSEFINKEYSKDSYFNLWDVSLRPETTFGSYEYAQHLLNWLTDIKYKAPLVVYQHWKSFRNEQDQPTKFMRLKEFYQLEFQIIYFESTQNDYSIELIPKVKEILEKLIGKECRIEDSDRLPKYSESTTDIVVCDNNMEIASISKRNDFPMWNWNKMKVLEVAIWTDRLIYNRYEN